MTRRHVAASLRARALLVVLLVPTLTSVVPAHADDAEPVAMTSTVRLRLIDENRWPLNGVELKWRENGDEWGSTRADGTATFTVDLTEPTTVSIETSNYYGNAIAEARDIVVKNLRPGETRDLGTLTYRILAPAHRARTAIKVSSKAAVTKAYKKQYASQLKHGKPVKVKGCTVGATPQSSQKRALSALNFARSLVGLETVRLDKKLSKSASQAALLQYRQGYLDHYPSKKVRCWTKARANASARSNLSMRGLDGALTVKAYLDDAGWGNEDAGHRDWLLTPSLGKIGFGSAGDFNALYVKNDESVDLAGKGAEPLWRSWPSAGWFPAQLEPSGRWSFTTARGDISFAKAKVTVKVGGKKVKQSVVSRAGQLVFDLATPPKVKKGKVVKVTVTISGMVLREKTKLPAHSYTVKLFRA